MIWQHLRGHDEQVEMFRRCLGRGRLSHAYLFLGPEGVGKKSFARALAQCLFCRQYDDTELQACGECPDCRQMTAGSHPDFLSVGVPEGKSELPIELIAGPQERRGREGLCYEMSLSPMSASRKVAVIDDAHRMTEESTNALLKTLEEPPPDSVLILVTGSGGDLLPTIRSRCQHVRFSPLSTADLTELLLELGLTTEREEAAATAALSRGSLAVAGQLLDPSLRDLRQTLYKRLAARNFNPLKTAEEMIAGVEEIGGDAQSQRTAAQWIVRFAIEFYSRALQILSGRESDAPIESVRRFADSFDGPEPEDLETVMHLIERASLGETQLERRTPVPLCLETLFDDFSRILRGATVPSP